MTVTIGWNELIEDIANKLTVLLTQRLDNRLYLFHMKRVRSMRTPSMKAIYLFILESQPVSFYGVRRAISLTKRTINKCLKELLKLRYIEIDENNMYYIVPE